MAKVKAPNGDIYDLPEAVASGLVNSENSGFEAVADEPKPETKPAAKRAASKK